MRKLKLQVQMSVDGFIAGPKGEMDWMVLDWDDKIRNYVFELTEPVDTILLGRKMTDGFISYWSDVMTKPDDPSSIDRSHAFAKKMIDTPKIVFTKTLKKSQWPNTERLLHKKIKIPCLIHTTNKLPICGWCFNVHWVGLVAPKQ
jgi:dihydrofolate reductase